MMADGHEQDAVMSTDDRLLYMANQIARNVASEGDDRAAQMVADHIRDFWDPTMRTRILNLSAIQPDALSPIAADAIGRLRMSMPPQRG